MGVLTDGLAVNLPPVDPRWVVGVVAIVPATILVCVAGLIGLMAMVCPSRAAVADRFCPLLLSTAVALVSGRGPGL